LVTLKICRNSGLRYTIPMAFGEKGTSYISWEQGIFFGLILESKGYLYYDPIMLTGLTENLVQISENNAIYKWRTRKRK